VKKSFISLHARTYAHATEDLGKVKLAFTNALGSIETKTTRTDGHHGNPITVLEAETTDARAIGEFFGRLSEEDLKALLATIDERIDDGCNLFLRLDKQAAYEGVVRLGGGEDVISVRIKVGAFPSRREIAKDIVRTFAHEDLSKRGERSER